MIHFPRSDLAKRFVQALSGRDPLSDAPNGLFLAAPRRTGKTAFLRNDLIPALRAAGTLPVYVDLWEHKGRDPGELIADGVGRKAAESMSLLRKAARAVGGSVNLGPVRFDFDPAKVGKTDGISIPEALQRLHAAVKRPICLIVDEAQHALTSDEGVRAMASLKSARDQMNKPGEVNLMLVMSGSDRDKLLRLVNTNTASFFGSQITKMPLLGSDFVAHVARSIAAIHPEVANVGLPNLEEVFRLFGGRPQLLISAIDATFAGGFSGEGFDAALLARARRAAAEAEEQMAATYSALTGLQQAVLWWMLSAGASFRPYDAKALAFYREKTHRKVVAARAQKALEQLRDRDDPLVWKSARGEYSVADSGMLRWFERLSQAGKWPPTLGTAKR